MKEIVPPGIKPCSPAPEADTLTTILPQQMYFMLIHRGPTTVIPSKADFFSGSEWHPFFKNHYGLALRNKTTKCSEL